MSRVRPPGRGAEQRHRVRDLAEPALLLDAWDQASVAPVAGRGAVLVRLAGLCPDLDSALDLGVGECAALATLAHLRAFGREVAGVITCSSCGELLSAQVSLPAAEELVAAAAAGCREVAVGEFTVRAPTTRDLLAAAATPDRAYAVLLSRCVRRGDGSPVDPAQLTQEEAALLDEAAETITAATMTTLCVRCPACGEHVRAALDTAAVLWERVDIAAPALMEEVAVLARAFGWSEADLLAMPAARRAAYLERVET
ncbi:hypothetical protein [Streptomyces sp. JHA26]|uniref:hypothetical protein n=1 Tax=Streptomyces sp. JHA26 TaxID=1917143 RepID=UPI00098B380D|nr:hypothetical protein [Streptomyces sp. JHA26]